MDTSQALPSASSAPRSLSTSTGGEIAAKPTSIHVEDSDRITTKASRTLSPKSREIKRLKKKLEKVTTAAEKSNDENMRMKRLLSKDREKAEKNRLRLPSRRRRRLPRRASLTDGSGSETSVGSREFIYDHASDHGSVDRRMWRDKAGCSDVESSAGEEEEQLHANTAKSNQLPEIEDADSSSSSESEDARGSDSEDDISSLPPEDEEEYKMIPVQDLDSKMKEYTAMMARKNLLSEDLKNAPGPVKVELTESRPSLTRPRAGSDPRSPSGRTAGRKARRGSAPNPFIQFRQPSLESPGGDSDNDFKVSLAIDSGSRRGSVAMGLKPRRMSMSESLLRMITPASMQKHEVRTIKEGSIDQLGKRGFRNSKFLRLVEENGKIKLEVWAGNGATSLESEIPIDEIKMLTMRHGRHIKEGYVVADSDNVLTVAFGEGPHESFWDFFYFGGTQENTFGWKNTLVECQMSQ